MKIYAIIFSLAVILFAGTEACHRSPCPTFPGKK